jgi:hypothetical protein
MARLPTVQFVDDVGERADVYLEVRKRRGHIFFE